MSSFDEKVLQDEQSRVAQLDTHLQQLVNEVQQLRNEEIQKFTQSNPLSQLSILIDSFLPENKSRPKNIHELIYSKKKYSAIFAEI